MKGKALKSGCNYERIPLVLLIKYETVKIDGDPSRQCQGMRFFVLLEYHVRTIRRRR